MPARARGRRLRVLTWHVHGNYLWNLTQTPHDFYVPFRAGGAPGYGGRSPGFPWPSNLHQVASSDVRRRAFDVILFQTHRNWTVDQYELLSEEQRRLPRICIEHDPPLEHPVGQRHPVQDDDVLIVHVTPFNALAWDTGDVPTCVIDHGVVVPPGVRYTGELARGIVAVNNLRERGRRLGADVFLRARERVPLDLVGLDAESLDGVGPVPPPELRAFEARYRFLFHPSRWSSLGLAVIEAMSIGMPIVALATTEMPTVIEDGVHGFIDTDVDRLIERMRALIADPRLARALGANARERARERFHIDRFTNDWDRALRLVAGRARPSARPRPANADAVAKEEGQWAIVSP